MLQLTFTLTIFVNALLLFLVQPLFARMALPLLGGAPAVWNTALVFYQAMLLLGYGWAHLSTRLFGMRRQPWVHLVLMATVFLTLPIGIRNNWQPPTDSSPIPALLGMMFVSVGIPFFVVSAGSPLLQKWFGTTRHPNAADPYFLYAASNTGSLLSLLAYPFLIEPMLPVRLQSRLWAVGYGFLVALTVLCALLRIRSAETDTNEVSNAEGSERSIPPQRILRWIALAFFPTSLMSGVTTYISTDVAALPLLWVMPLALFLLTFVFAFSARPPLPLPWLRRAFPIAAVALTLVLSTHASQPLPLLIVLHLTTFFLAAMVCHSQLAADRPSSSHLTAFYLWISLGGVLGGAFNGLLAPLLFSTVIEYPLTLVSVCFFLPRSGPPDKRRVLPDVLVPLAVGALTIVSGMLTAAAGLQGQSALALIFGLPVLLCYFSSAHPLRFGLSLAAVLLAGMRIPGEQNSIVHTERSFFGVNRVATDTTAGTTRLYHGNVLHGIQYHDAARRTHPTLYYARKAPIGEILAFRMRRPDAARLQVAVVGLGAGTLAAYGQAGQTWTCYEIDPVVTKIANDTRFFTFLHDSPAQIRIRMGDARLTLAATTDTYDLLILDAYSSDAIPVHLLTREALQLYHRRLRPGGLIALHISSAHFNLAPVVQTLARDAGWFCRIHEEEADSRVETNDSQTTARWAVLAERPEDLGPLATDVRWTPPPLRKPILWTDQYSSILPLLSGD